MAQVTPQRRDVGVDIRRAEYVDVTNQVPRVFVERLTGFERRELAPCRCCALAGVLALGRLRRYQSRERHHIHAVGAVICVNNCPHGSQLCIADTGTSQLCGRQWFRHRQAGLFDDTAERFLRMPAQIDRLCCVPYRLQTIAHAGESTPDRRHQWNSHCFADIGEDRSRCARSRGLVHGSNGVIRKISTHLRALQ